MKRELVETNLIEEIRGALDDTPVLRHESGQVEPFMIETLSNVFSETMSKITNRQGMIKHAIVLLAVVRNLDMADEQEKLNGN